MTEERDYVSEWKQMAEDMDNTLDLADMTPANGFEGVFIRVEIPQPKIDYSFIWPILSMCAIGFIMINIFSIIWR